MIRRILPAGVAVAAALLWPAGALADAPPNDDFANAMQISTVPFSDSVDPRTATTEPPEPPPACDFSTAGTVWYSYTPSGDGTVETFIDSALVNPGIVSVYTGSGLSSLDLVGCRSFFGPTSPLTFAATAGTTYYFQARALSETAAELTFSLKFRAAGPPAVANDNFADARQLAALPFSDVVDNTEATSEDGEPTWCGPTNETIWYRFTPTSTGVVRADTSGSAFPISELAVYEQNAGGFGGLSFTGCVFNGNPLYFTAEAGHTYYLQAGSFIVGGGLLHVNLQAVPPPPNDDFEQATPIASLPFSADLEILGATIQPGEPTPCRFPVKGTAWYAFTPTVSGTYTGGLTSPSAFTFVVAYGIYTGTTLADLRQTACNLGNPLEFDAERGTTYYIQVANHVGLGSSSTFSLRLLHARDSTPPAITPIVTGTLGDDGWYVSDVGVTWSVDDPESPVSAKTGCDTSTVASDTSGVTFSCSATSDGGTATQSLTIKRDATPPTAACAATPNVMWAPTHKLVPVTTTVAVSDATSGGAGFVLTGVTSNEGTPSLDIVDWTAGAADTHGQLRSERLGTSADRVYTLAYRGFDGAGNAGTCEVSVTVPHDQRE
jgi:hypothetical protein